jgi:hypothetical protein
LALADECVAGTRAGYLGPGRVRNPPLRLKAIVGVVKTIYKVARDQAKRGSRVTSFPGKT